MGNDVKKIIKRVLLVVAAILILFLAVALFYYYPMLTMPSVKTGQIPDTNVITVDAMSMGK